MSVHRCHWPGCMLEVPPKMWGCRQHWFMLPIHLRNRIWKTYQQGQEIDKDPSPEYLATAQDVQVWCEKFIREQGAKRDAKRF